MKETLTFRGKEYEKYLSDMKKLIKTRNQLEIEQRIIKKNLHKTLSEIKGLEQWLINN